MLNTVQIRDVIIKKLFVPPFTSSVYFYLVICSKTFSFKGPTKDRVVIGNAIVNAHLLRIVSGEKEAFPFNCLN